MGYMTAYAYILTASADSSGVADAVVIPAGRKFNLWRVQFVFPPGSNFLLKVAVLLGETQKVPESGYIVGDGHRIPVDCDVL